jgi:hypothetical protein
LTAGTQVTAPHVRGRGGRERAARRRSS